MGNLVCYRNSKAIVRIYEPIRLLPDVRLKPFLIPDAIKASRGQYYFVLEYWSYVANITFVYTRLRVGQFLSSHIVDFHLSFILKWNGFVYFPAVSSMRPIDSTNCILVQDIKAVTHENAHIHDSISTQIPTEGKYRAVLICIYSAWCKYSRAQRHTLIAFGKCEWMNISSI